MKVNTTRRRQVVLVAMILANSIILIDQTAVPLALPAIISDFGIGAQSAQWVLNASLLALAGFLVLGGRLGDQFGRRRIFLIGAVAFTAGSVVGGLAPVYVVLVAARVVQGLGGAFILPGSVAIVSATFPPEERGKALGTTGGIAAVAGALGPTIGGALTSAVSWRLVLLINVPLAAGCILATLIAVPKDQSARQDVDVDYAGAALLCIAVTGLVFGLSGIQSYSFTSTLVLGPVVISVFSGVTFIFWERRAAQPLMNLRLIRTTPNYLGATISQTLAGMVEIGLGVIFPLLLVLDLGMSPVLAGLALIPTTVPMIFLAAPVGRWYDRSGGRPPLVVGFGLLALSAVALGVGVHQIGPTSRDYLVLLPGLVLFGSGLALVLTVNDPVGLDSVNEGLTGQVAGVSATAEQAGGAVGIAALFAVFHGVYVHRLRDLAQHGSVGGITSHQGDQLRQALQAAEQTGLQPQHFDQSLVRFLVPAFNASKLAYGAVFLVVFVLAVIGLLSSARLVRQPARSPESVAAGDGSAPLVD